MTSRKRRRRKQQSGPVGDLFKFLFALILIAAAVLVVFFVSRQIRGLTDALLPGTSEETEAESIEISVEEETTRGLAYGLFTDEDGTRRFRKDDGTLANEEWIAVGSKLYYANAQSALQTGTKGIEGMIYTFSEDGSLEKIRYNANYQPEAGSVLKDYPALVKSKRVWAFLNEEETLGAFPIIMYKKTTEAMAYVLGGDQNPQYTGAYSMQIDGDEIYFLPLSGKTDTELTKEEAAINGNLYRMKPGDTERELVAGQVEGYRVLDGTIWYYADGRLSVTRDAETDTTKNPRRASSGDEVLTVVTGDGAAYLTDANGRTVTSTDGTVKARGFTYYLYDDGTIKGVNEKKSVSTGGYVYYVEGDTAFGEPVSRMMRKDQSGNTEIISTEFPGTVGNLRYHYDTGNIIAEYTDERGTGHVIRLTKNGDAELLNGTLTLSGTPTILAIQNGSVLCMQQSSGSAVFTEVSLTDASPLAVGIDPISIGGSAETETAKDTETVAAPDQGAQAAATEAVTKAAQPGGTAASSAQSQDTVIAAPGSQDDVQIGNAPPG